MPHVWGEGKTQFFNTLGADEILNAIEELGLKPTGAVHTLTSMENRVYDIELEGEDIEETTNVIAKFYRPGRWSQAQILEEHQFLKQLNDAEIAVIPPIEINNNTLFEIPSTGIFYTLFKKQGGRALDEFDDGQIEQLGRLLARLHSVGKGEAARHRLKLTPEIFAKNNINFLLENNILPSDLRDKYRDAVNKLCELITPLFENATYQRIHGDCHINNIIWKNNQAMLVDFDDFVMGPPVQDIWLLLPGNDAHSKRQRTLLIDAYDDLCDFDYTSLKLIEPLRALRFVHFSSWLARRYEDEAFKRAFPFFANGDYWHIELQDLYQQIAIIEAT